MTSLRPRPTFLVTLVVLALALTGCGSSTNLTEATAFLDGAYSYDATTSQWRTGDAPSVVADNMQINLKADDSVRESGNYYLRGSDWLAVVRTEAEGSSIELDDYDAGYRRHSTFIAGYWGSRPGSYGPRSSGGSSGGGGFTGVRGGGSGSGK